MTYTIHFQPEEMAFMTLVTQMTVWSDEGLNEVIAEARRFITNFGGYAKW